MKSASPGDSGELYPKENQTEVYSLISQVDIPDHLECYVSLQSMLDKMTESEIDNISKYILSQNQQFLLEAIQIMISFHDIRPLQRNLITKLISAVSSPFAFNFYFLIIHHPFLAYHLSRAEFHPASEHERIQSEIQSIVRAENIKHLTANFELLLSHSKIRSGLVPNCFREGYGAEDFELEGVREWGYEGNSQGFIVKYDDFVGLRALSAHPLFKFDIEIFISPFDLPVDVKSQAQSLLSVSAFYGALKCFKFLLLNGCRVSASVCEFSVKGGSLEVIRISEQEGGDFTHCLPASVSYMRNDIADWLLQNFEVGKFSFADCIASANFACILYLLADEADVNQSFAHGQTPLILSSEKGFLEICRLLIEHGAAIDQQNVIGQSPLFISSSNCHLEICELLIERGSDIDLQNVYGFSPLHASSQEGRLEVCKLLIDHGSDINLQNNDGWSPLHFSSLHGHLEICKLLIDHGSDINLQGKMGWYPLYAASLGDQLEAFKLLVDHGADINLQDEQGESPLFVSSKYNRLEICKFVIEGGSDINVPDKQGQSPLFISCSRGHLEICKLLIEHGSDINQQNERGKGPLFISCSKGHLEICKLLIEHGSDINLPNRDGQSPLQISFANAHLEVYNLLIESGANPHNEDNNPQLFPSPTN
jgi:ankyrin repeat protein